VSTIVQTIDTNVNTSPVITLNTGDYFYQLPGISLTTADGSFPAILANGPSTVEIHGTVFSPSVGIGGAVATLMIGAASNVSGGTKGVQSQNTTTTNYYTINGNLTGGVYGLESSGTNTLYLKVGATGVVTGLTANAINLAYDVVYATVDGNVSGNLGIGQSNTNGIFSLSVTQGARVTATSSYAIAFSNAGNLNINGQVAGFHGISSTTGQQLTINVGTTGSVAGSSGDGIDLMSQSATIAVNGGVTGLGDGIFNGQSMGTTNIMVGAGGFVSGFAGIEVENNGTVGVGGTVNGNHFWGITLGQFIEGGEIHVYAGGLVTGGGSTGGGIRIRGGHLITNDGTVSSTDGAAIYGENGAGYLLNTGMITGSTVGVLFSDTFDANDVHTTVNTGTIAGSPNPQSPPGPNFFAYDAAGNIGTDRVINQGTLIGDVRLGQHAGSNLVNAGTLTGNVFLGAGGQTANSTLGTVSGLMVGGSGADTIVGGQSGNNIVGGAGNDVLYANPTMDAARNHAMTQLAGGTGSNALYGGGGYNTFVGGDTNGGYNQIWGGASGMMGVAGFANNTLTFAAMAPSQSVYVDLLNGHNAFINSGPNQSGVYTYEDSIINVPNVIGSASGDIIIADNGIDRIAGDDGADSLTAGTGPSSQDSFVYNDYADSNLIMGYDTVLGFKVAADKIDLSAFHSDASHLVIQTAGFNNNVYLEVTPGSFNAATDLAISVVATVNTGLTTANFVF
jgi:hypothetical protein